MTLEKNVGGCDKAVRIIVGIVLLSLVSLKFIGPQSNWALLGLLGLGLIISGFMGHCPPYKMLGINTNKKSK